MKKGKPEISINNQNKSFTELIILNQSQLNHDYKEYQNYHTLIDNQDTHINNNSSVFLRCGFLFMANDQDKNQWKINLNIFMIHKY